MAKSDDRSSRAEQIALVLDAMLEKREGLVSQIETFVNDGAAEKRMFDALVDKTTSAATAPIQAELSDLDRQMVEVFSQNRSLFGRTVKLPHGILKWFNAPVSLQLPRDIQGVVKVLLKRRGGKKHLRVKYEPIVSSLVWADRRLLRAIDAKRQAYELLQLNRVDSEGESVGKSIELQRRLRPVRRASDKD